MNNASISLRRSPPLATLRWDLLNLTWTVSAGESERCKLRHITFRCSAGFDPFNKGILFQVSSFGSTRLTNSSAPWPDSDKPASRTCQLQQWFSLERSYRPQASHLMRILPVSLLQRRSREVPMGLICIYLTYHNAKSVVF